MQGYGQGILGNDQIDIELTYKQNESKQNRYSSFDIS